MRNMIQRTCKCLLSPVVLKLRMSDSYGAFGANL